MSNFDTDEQDEKPLDPVLEKVRRKMVRLQIVSAGVMFISLMAVLTAVVYKVRHSPTPEKAQTEGFSIPSDQPRAATVRLPAGFKVTSTALSGTQILFYGTTAEGQNKAYVFDLAIGRVVADVTVAQ
ncbi:hypothetical protein [Allorhizobium terrae]|uniref:Fimbrial protein n=1 Tax=Allorhizobium terrae TaxID=1848972 RepID=A0A4S4A5J3_9HYPH|nr:hypothetical protein [Allorhizobium terrae]THF53629.1 hypothetical protein E6C51_00430 [Allorhizobium terrae]TWD54179.1 hypothetical protein FB480_10387 [Agrobacterium vitis]